MTEPNYVLLLVNGNDDDDGGALLASNSNNSEYVLKMVDFKKEYALTIVVVTMNLFHPLPRT